MSEASTPQPARPQPPEELHWGISYLREDIQDLRQEMRDNTQGVRQELREEIRLLHGRMDVLATTMNTRIDQVYTKLDAKIDTKFYWTLGTILLTWVSTILAVLFK